MTDSQIKLIGYLARDGMELEQIRRELGIKRKEWNEYFNLHPEEKTRLKTLRISTDYAVEDALLRRALGYEVNEYRQTEKPGGIEEVTTKKDVAPDVRAAILWLEARQTKRWGKKASESYSKVDEILEILDKEAGKNENE